MLLPNTGTQGTPPSHTLQLGLDSLEQNVAAAIDPNALTGGFHKGTVCGCLYD